MVTTFPPSRLVLQICGLPCRQSTSLGDLLSQGATWLERGERVANLLLLMTDEIRLATLLIRRVVPGRQCSTCNLCERLSCLLNRIKMLMAMPQVGEILPPTTAAAGNGNGDGVR